MKKVIILSLLLISILIAGCLDYKTYKFNGEESQDDALLEEIEKIENELSQEQSPSQPTGEAVTEVAEEIILPELGEEQAASLETKTLTVNENEVVRLKLSANDPDNDKLSYSFSPPLNELGVWRTKYGDAGEYLVIIKATDGKSSTEMPVKIIVKKVNVPPVIKNLKDIKVKEGETITFNPEVIDPNGDKVDISVSEPLKTYSFATDHTSAGEYQITVAATDGELTVEENFMLVIENVNQVPELKDLEDLIVKEGELVKLEPGVSDLDNEEIKLTITEPVGDDGIWQTGYTDHGEYQVTVSASDGKDTVTKVISITVEDVNMPPEIIDVYLENN